MASARDPESRFDVLQRITTHKTVTPGVKDVLLDGCAIGRIARNPRGVGWVATCSRWTMYWSAADASLALVRDAGVLP